jgi:dTDP-4-dehydrorhamnose reductase
VYAPRGRNFMLTMLKLAQTRAELRVVDDQRGAPTASRELARATLAIIEGDAMRPIAMEAIERAGSRCGLYHASAAGETTWFGFAQEIFRQWSACAKDGFRAPRLVPIPTREYPTPARRPANSVLSNERLRSTFGVALAPWQDELAEAISTLADGGG